jgi:hypothetical protein
MKPVHVFKGIAALSLHFRFAGTTSAFKFIRCLTQAHMNMVARLTMCMRVCCTVRIYMQRDTLMVCLVCGVTLCFMR